MKVQWFKNVVVGDKLRHATLHGASDGGVKHVEALLHVMAVFDGLDGQRHVVTAEWFPSKRRWHYETYDELHAVIGTIWPDGHPRPT